MSEINNADQVVSKEDFVAFLGSLLQDLINNPAKWENNTLDRYLEAMQAWTVDMNGYYRNMGLPIPENVSWNVFAKILSAAVVYE